MSQCTAPLVSIIVPAYNYAHYLGACLESALAQTYEHTEVLVVDDGSEDDTAALCSRFPQVRYIYQPHNGNGTVRAINRGIREARGQFIAWLSADDRFTPDKIAKQVKALSEAQTKDPDVCLVHADVFYEANEAEGLRHCPLSETEQHRQLADSGYVRWAANLPEFPGDQNPLQIMRHNLVNGCATLIDRRVFDELGYFDESMPRTGDVEMWSRMLAAGKRFAFLPEPLTITRIHAANTAQWHEVPAEYNLIRRKRLEQTPLERFFPQLSEEPALARPAREVIGNILLEQGAFDAAMEQFELAGLASTDSRIVRAKGALPPEQEDLPPLDLSSATTRFLMVCDEGSDVARSHLVLSHYLQAFSAHDRISLTVLIPADAPSALTAFAHRFEAVCDALGIDPESQPHADVTVVVEPDDADTWTYRQQLFNTCHAYIPLGTQDDSTWFALARRAKLAIVFDAGTEALKAMAKKATPEAIDIVLLTHNRLDYLRRMLDALYERTQHPFRLTIVDNASGPDVRAYLQENLPRFHRVVFNTENRWTEAFTQGIDLTRSDPFIVSDPDIVVPQADPCWLTEMLRLMNEHPEMGMLALNLDPSNKPAKMPAVYISPMDPYGPDITLSAVGTVMQTIRRRYFVPPYETDFKAVRSIQQQGGLVGFATNLLGYHLGWDEERDYPEHLLKKYHYFNDTYHTDVYKLYTEDASLLQAMGQDGELISLILPVADEADDVLACLEALIQATNAERTPFETILVEIRPTTTEHEALYRSLEGDVQVIRTSEPISLGAALNRGVQAAKGQRLVFLEPMALPLVGWLEGLIHGLSEAEIAGAALLGPDGHLLRSGYVFRHSGSNPLTANDLIPIPAYAGIPLSSTAVQGRRTYQAVVGGALAIHVDQFQAIGGFDAELSGDYLWMDLCLRASHSGTRVVACHDARLVTKESVSISPRESYISYERFQARWGERVSEDALARFSADGFKLAGLSAPNGGIKAVVLIGPSEEILTAPGLHEPWTTDLLTRSGDKWLLPEAGSSRAWVLRDVQIADGYELTLRYDDEIDPDCPNNSPAWQLQLVGEGKRVLEIGCSTGKMTRHMVARGCQVVGIEIDPATARLAERYAERVIVGDLETLDLRAVLAIDSFDVILAGDVLEHLKDPVAVLSRLRQFLRPGGAVVGSVPNIAHGGVRLALMAGQWRYRRLGLLDRTHVHFFTRWGLQEALRQAGYHVETMWATVGDINGMDLQVPAGVLPPEIIQAIHADPESGHYQFVFRAFPAEPGDVPRTPSLLAVPAKPLNRGPKVLAILPSETPLSACPAVRLAYPLREATRQGLLQSRLACLYAPDMTLERLAEDIKWAEIVVLQRLVLPEHLTLLELCRSMGKRVIYELDDDLLNLPQTNYNRAHLDNPERSETIRTFLREADLVTVSTVALAESISRHCRAVEVVPNALPEPPFTRHFDTRAHHEAEHVVIGYAGTSTHQADLAQATPALKRLLEEDPGRVRLVFLGCLPPELTGHPAVTHIPENADYEAFSRNLKNSGIHIGLAPLVDNAFNRAKSALKWMEYSACGIVSVCSAVGPYADAVTDGRDGLLIQEANSEAWFQALDRLVRDKSLRIALATQAQRAIWDHHALSSSAAKLANAYRQTLTGAAHSPCSIVIPVFNKVEYTQACLESIIRHTPAGSYEVILVDNASTDGTSEFLQRLEGDVTIISNAENLGFAKACNQGAAAAKHPYILFLNNDTEAHSGWLEPLVRTLETEPDIAAVGSKLLFADRTLQHAGVEIVEEQGLDIPLCPNHRFYRWPGDAPEANRRTDVQVLTAAAMLVRAEAFQKVGGFDEAYWNGYEDVDLCFKLGAAGYRLVYEPKSCLTHYESVSGPERRIKENANLALLTERWLGRIKPDFLRTPEGVKRVHPSRSVTSLIVVTYNSSATIEGCLASALRTLGEQDEIVVVDNASQDHTPQILAEIAQRDERIKVHLSPENLGFSSGSNLGIRNAVGDYVVLLNPDTEVYPGWLDHMLSVVHLDDVGAVGPTSDYVAGRQKWQLYAPAGLPADASPERIAAELGGANANRAAETKLLIGFCMLLPRKVLDHVGLLDDDLFLGNDDLDLSWRLRNAGYRLLVSTGSFVHHIGQVSFDTEPKERTKRLVQESTDVLARKLVRHYGAGHVPSPMELWEMSWFSPSPGILEGAEPMDGPRPTSVATLPDRRGFNIVLADPDPERLRATLSTYVAAFTAESDVALHVLAGKELPRIQERVLEILDALGVSADAIPDVSLLDAPDDPAELPAFMQAADLVIGTPALVERAAELGRRALAWPETDALRSAVEGSIPGGSGVQAAFDGGTPEC